MGAILAFGLSWSFMPMRFYLQSRWFPDDAFYYFNVARNLVDGYGPTFDRINTTNGFQPLWLLVCAVINAIVHGRVAFIHAINVVQVILAVVSFGCLYRAAWMNSREAVASFLALGALFCFGRFSLALVSGLETGLYLCCFSIALVLLLRIERDGISPKRAFLLGVSLASVILARLDGGIFCVLVCAYLATLRPGRRCVVAFLAPLMLTVVPYLIYNKLSFGYWTPLSGKVKEVWGSIAYHNALQAGSGRIDIWFHALIWPLTNQDFYPVGCVVLANIVIGLVYLAMRQRVLCLVQVFFIAKYVCYVYLFFDYAVYSWYYTVDFVGPALFAAYIFSRAVHHVAPPIWQNVTRCVLLLPAAYWLVCHLATDPGSIREFLNHQRSVFDPNQPLANELDAYLASAKQLNAMRIEPRTIFAAHNAGVLGYFLKYRVVNVDGLINGRTRYEYLLHDGWDFMPYLDHGQHIDAYIDSLALNAKADYDKGFITQRAFDEIPLRELLERSYGRNDMACYIRKGHWTRHGRADSEEDSFAHDP